MPIPFKMSPNQPFRTKRTQDLYDRLTSLSSSVWNIAELYEKATIGRLNVDSAVLREEKQKLKLQMARLLNAVGEIEKTIEDLQ